jgi:hypothetical protein
MIKHHFGQRSSWGLTVKKGPWRPSSAYDAFGVQDQTHAGHAAYKTFEVPNPTRGGDNFTLARTITPSVKYNGNGKYTPQSVVGKLRKTYLGEQTYKNDKQGFVRGLGEREAAFNGSTREGPGMFGAPFHLGEGNVDFPDLSTHDINYKHEEDARNPIVMNQYIYNNLNGKRGREDGVDDYDAGERSYKRTNTGPFHSYNQSLEVDPVDQLASPNTVVKNPLNAALDTILKQEEENNLVSGVPIVQNSNIAVSMIDDLHQLLEHLTDTQPGSDWREIIGSLLDDGINEDDAKKYLRQYVQSSNSGIDDNALAANAAGPVPDESAGGEATTGGGGVPTGGVADTGVSSNDPIPQNPTLEPKLTESNEPLADVEDLERDDINNTEIGDDGDNYYYEAESGADLDQLAQAVGTTVGLETNGDVFREALLNNGIAPSKIPNQPTAAQTENLLSQSSVVDEPSNTEQRKFTLDVFRKLGWNPIVELSIGKRKRDEDVAGYQKRRRGSFPTEITVPPLKFAAQTNPGVKRRRRVGSIGDNTGNVKKNKPSPVDKYKMAAETNKGVKRGRRVGSVGDIDRQTKRSNYGEGSGNFYQTEKVVKA